VARRHRQLAGQLLAELKIHPGQERVLMLLRARDGPTQAELAEGLRVEPPTVSRMVAALERCGLVTRRRSLRDRRALAVELTEAGRALQGRFDELWAELAERTTAGLSPTERAELVRLLGVLAATLGAAPGIDACAAGAPCAGDATGGAAETGRSPAAGGGCG
jgi:DNA-binding MarR family transcriptional regulator